MSPSFKDTNGRRRLRLKGTRTALLALALAAAAPSAAPALAVLPAGEPAATARHAALTEVATPALTPGLPPPELASLSDRRIVAGVILVLFAGLSGLTITMWRELARGVDRS